MLVDMSSEEVRDFDDTRNGHEVHRYFTIIV